MLEENKIKEEVVHGDINWSLFESKSAFLKITDELQDVVLARWYSGENSFEGNITKGLWFDVTEVDGDKVEQKFFTSSTRLINKLKPELVKARKMGEDSIKVRIFKEGIGKNTTYGVKFL